MSRGAVAHGAWLSGTQLHAGAEVGLPGTTSIPPSVTWAERSASWSRNLDRLLRGTVRLGVHTDRALAQALTILKKKKLYFALGFVRLSDYVRETLGLGMRQAQEMIHTEERLKELPWIASFLRRP